MEGGIPITNRGIERARDKHKSSLLITMIRLTYQWWPQTQAEADALRAALRWTTCVKKRRESFAPRPSSPPVVVQPISL